MTSCTEHSRVVERVDNIKSDLQEIKIMLKEMKQETVLRLNDHATRLRTLEIDSSKIRAQAAIIGALISLMIALGGIATSWHFKSYENNRPVCEEKYYGEQGNR